MSNEPQPNNLEQALDAAVRSEHYLVAVWRITAGRVHLYREAQSFPTDEFSTAQALLGRDLTGEAEAAPKPNS